MSQLQDIALHPSPHNHHPKHKHCSCHDSNTSPYAWPWYPYLENIQPCKHQHEKQFKTQLHHLLYQDNPYLVSGYRKLPIQSIKKCIYSIFTLHNETLNIWTHLLPAFYFSYLIVYCTWQAYEFGKDRADIFISLFYYTSAALIYYLSAFYHVFRMNSESAYHFCLICDLRGIISMFSGSNIWCAYFMLKGFDRVATVMTSISFAGYFYLWFWIPHMVKRRLSNRRTLYFGIFSTLGLVCMFVRLFLQFEYIFQPALEGKLSFLDLLMNTLFGNEISIISNDTAINNDTMQMILQLLNFNQLLFRKIILRSFSLLAFAMVIRVLKFPEKFFPYTFDIVGASHQLFHSIVALSPILNHLDLWESYIENDQFSLHHDLLEMVKF
ncbi:hypothetical protein C9374_007937 [Naegleria lovaniensis]|uniref:Uncharacterized protein n=1 Tax=Naegleria lovaniensis TaxID=51637 RepID=A0AA88GG61_NAELO|nr:uncharacterized protein C9374_007937 [Naegleria lovaniensis]KAG2378789.1 hypothetical protein C9374_007937 [Naegleria lovaniensis]